VWWGKSKNNISLISISDLHDFCTKKMQDISSGCQQHEHNTHAYIIILVWSLPRNYVLISLNSLSKWNNNKRYQMPPSANRNYGTMSFVSSVSWIQCFLNVLINGEKKSPKEVWRESLDSRLETINTTVNKIHYCVHRGIKLTRISYSSKQDYMTRETWGILYCRITPCVGKWSPQKTT